MSAGDNAGRDHGRVRCGKAAEPGIWRRAGHSIRSTSGLDCLRCAQPAGKSVWRIYTAGRWRVRTAISARTEAQFIRCQIIWAAITTGERIWAAISSRREAICFWRTSLRTACSASYDIAFRPTLQRIRCTRIWSTFAARERPGFRSALSAGWRPRVRPTFAAK